MNIREIKNEILNENFISQSELNEKILSYINDRVLSFTIKHQDNERLSILKTNYQNCLIELLNPSLQQITNQKIFKCHYHSELEIESNDNIIELIDGDYICRDAYDEEYFECDICNGIDHTNRRNHCDSRDDQYCEVCYEDRVRYCDDCDTNYDENDYCECNNEEERNNLLNYRAKNKLYSHGKENSILFYGNETELQAYRDQSRYDIVEKFNECFNYDGFENILCKHDGSLDTDKGFEMSSTNCSFEYHKETFWNDFFELNPAQYCKAYNGYQCGIHWHFNRNVFTENQLRRLNCFYNHPKNKNLIVDIAGREGYQYCKFVPSITFDDPIRTSGDEFKYRVINFNNEHTIEVRIFRSNLKKISFFRYLEFVHSVNEWIRASDQDNSENITWEYYFDWLLKNISRKFENLFFFLDDRKHFDHLENIEEWNYVYTNFKTLITDFRNNNQEEIELESEDI